MGKLVKLMLTGFMVFSIFSCGGGGSSTQNATLDNNTRNTPNTDNPTPPTNPTPPNNPTPPVETLSGNTFIGLYMVGSDLESDGDAGTTDLLELVKGYESLSASQKSDIYVYVAFGGANKDGWRGVKYANIECIIQDSKDKKFGNDNCYDYVQKITTQNLKNMSHPEAFKHFINKVKNMSTNFETKILVMWNHGGAYAGFGWDENWKTDGKSLDTKKGDISDNDKLTIYEIRDTLKSENVRFDIIGFDACLMANFEVASAIKDFGKYLVASEELEPGHGWDYADIIQRLANNINKSALDKTKLFVDSYVDNKSHEQGSGLTLSVIDLSKIDSLRTSLDNIDFNNLDLTQIISAEKTSQKYGYSMDGQTLEEDYFTVDMVQFFDKAQLTSIRDVAKSIVLYNKNDGSIVSNGISMASFSKIIDMIANNDTSFKTQKILPNSYFIGLENIQKSINTDKTEPTINPSNCTYNNKTGICLKVTDNTAVQDVGIYTLIPTQYGYSYLAVYDYLPKISQDTYFLDKSEYMSAVVFCDGPCSNPVNYTFAPVYFLQQTPLNELVYITPAVATVPTNKGNVDIDGYLIMKIDPVKGKFSVYFSVSPTSKIRLFVSKHITTLKFKYIVFDSQGNPSQQTQSLSFSNGFDMAVANLQNFGITPVIVVEAIDIAGNSSVFVPQ